MTAIDRSRRDVNFLASSLGFICLIAFLSSNFASAWYRVAMSLIYEPPENWAEMSPITQLRKGKKRKYA